MVHPHLLRSPGPPPLHPSTAPTRATFFRRFSPLAFPTAEPFHFMSKDQIVINTLLFRNPSRFFGVVAASRTPLLPPDSAFSSPRPLAKPFPYAYAHAFAGFHRPARLSGAKVAPRVWCGLALLPVLAGDARRAAGDGEGEGVGYWSWKEKGWWSRWWWWTKLVGLGQAEHKGCGNPEATVVGVERALVGLIGGRRVREKAG